MATKETQILDDIIASRRAMILGGSALAGMFMTGTANAASTVTTYTDADILNFALNLEYLEANFYYLAAFGTTIDVANAASMAANAAVQGIAGTGTQGKVLYKPNPKVPFSTVQVGSYGVEIAIEEGKHVGFLRTALGAMAVAQPQIDLTGGSGYPVTAAWNTLATAAGNINGGVFDPFLNDAFFLLGAYVFEDVGVTAYHGAAPLLTSKSNLQQAGGILAVEAYHSAIVRATINNLDPADAMGYQTITQKISTLRSTLSQAAVASAPNKYASSPAFPDDFGLPQRSFALDNGATVPVTQLVDADSNAIAFSRNTTQVLNIVTGGKGATAGTVAAGVFFPAGMNGTFK